MSNADVWAELDRMKAAAFPKKPRTTNQRGDDGPSADQRRTLHNAEMLANGLHPATGKPLLDGTETCGGCAFGHRYDYHNRAYWKCEKHRLGESHSAASDIRKGWPACALFEPEEGA